jgi:hypothetical protein
MLFEPNLVTKSNLNLLYEVEPCPPGVLIDKIGENILSTLNASSCITRSYIWVTPILIEHFTRT